MPGTGVITAFSKLLFLPVEESQVLEYDLGSGRLAGFQVGVGELQVGGRGDDEQ